MFNTRIPTDAGMQENINREELRPRLRYITEIHLTNNQLQPAQTVLQNQSSQQVAMRI